MPRQRSPAAAPEQAKAIVEQFTHSSNPERAGVAGCEFNGKRKSIEPAADRSDDRRINIVQHAAIAACRGALHEKLNSRILERFRRCQAPLFGRTIEGIEQVDMFTFNPESFAARC